MRNLTMIQPLLDEFKSTVKAIYGNRIVKILLYGSYARGEQHEESDIDLMVVLKDEGFDKKLDEKPIREITHRYLLDKQLVVMPVLVPYEKYLNDKSPFLFFVKKDQMEI
ncbi:MAG: nucleotidyltransferase domain-containing protein [Opitutaceae bacterium]|nr:nucleotidyltransferase domain-containing protein [Cytophagales bacterium]